MARMSGDSADITEEQKTKLRGLFPEVFSEGKVDWDKLKATLGQNVDIGERYNLSWKGKSDVFAEIQCPTTKTLKPARDESVEFENTENLFIEGDNLEVLKALQKSYYDKVKMIYIDPPYNTGNDFVYNDKFAQNKVNYAQESGMSDDEGRTTRSDGLTKNTKDSGHYHSDWLNMMYPRLYLARNLLRHDGVIFVSIDDNEVHNLRLILNEIFGEENFMGQMVWHARGRSKTPLSIDHEYVIVYAKDASIIAPQFDAQGNTPTWYGEPIERKYANPDNDTRGDWRDAQHTVTQKKAHYTYSINSQTGELVDEVVNNQEWYGHQTWMYAPNTIKDLYKDKRLVFIPNRDRLALKVKKFKSEEEPVTSLGGLIQRSEISSRHGSEEFDKLMGAGIFDYPKPVSLMARLVQAATRNNDIILDFFSGSGTVAHAVAQLNATDGGNRKWIMVQLPEETDKKSEAFKAGYKNIADIAKERIRRAVKKIKVEHPQAKFDDGFKLLKLSDTNFKTWDNSIRDEAGLKQQMLEHLSPIRKDSKEEDLLTELLIKSGVSFDTLIKPSEFDGAKYYFVESEEPLVICLAPEMTEPLFAKFLSGKPSKIIILDSSLKNNDQLKTNLLLQAEHAHAEVSII